MRHRPVLRGEGGLNIVLVAKRYSTWEDVMTGMLLKNLPESLHERLRARARANRRSMAAEVEVLLESALSDRAGSPTLEEIDALRIRGARPLTQAIVDQGRAEGRP
jgi:hypothetical protein